ncbi:MAG: ATP-dependent protease subunit HslV [Gemmatimonadota bacterium]|nr:MAG: ATP-dependent protease subunit HslV [Gemmatimonadota bacterium]
MRSTTIIGISHKGKVALGGDGQVTFNETIVKEKANKIRRMYNNTILAGFAGATADAFTLFDKLEGQLEKYNGNLSRAAVELAKTWRTDKYLRRLEALLAVVDKEHIFIISGSGDVLEPDDGIVAIGSGAPYALAAARALLKYSSLDARVIVREALEITASICVYTNSHIVIEEL